jgi:hypothetical protein
MAGSLVLAATLAGAGPEADWGGAAAQETEAPAWESLSPEEQARAREHYERYRALPESDRRRVEEGYQRWLALPPEQRERVRRNYEIYRDLGPDEQQSFDRSYRDWKARSAPSRETH